MPPTAMAVVTAVKGEIAGMVKGEIGGRKRLKIMKKLKRARWPNLQFCTASGLFRDPRSGKESVQRGSRCLADPDLQSHAICNLLNGRFCRSSA